MNVLAIRQRMNAIDAEQAHLEQIATRDGLFCPNDAQRARYITLGEEWNTLSQQLKTTEEKPEVLPRRVGAWAASPLGSSFGDDDGFRSTGVLTKPTGPKLVDQNGNPVRYVGPTERWSGPAVNANGESVSIGRTLRAIGIGNWRNASAEHALMAAQTGASSGGHYGIPDILADQTIDLMRANSVMNAAGMGVIGMTSDSLRVLKVLTDPQFELKGEAAAFTGSTMTFGAISFYAKLIGTTLEFSREMLEDAPNAAQVIEDTLGRSLAAEIDRLALNGSGSQEPVGVLNTTGIGSTASVGNPTWDDLLDAIADIEGNNHTVGSYIIHPDVKAFLSKLKTGDGTNSAAMYLAPPADVAALRRLVTTSMPSDQIAVGDFSRVLMALRQGASVETTSTSDTTFDRHTVRFKVTFRCDFGVTHAAAIHALQGVTLS